MSVAISLSVQVEFTHFTILLKLTVQDWYIRNT